MSEQTKKTTNVTVEQIIEHMTADIQNSDGQYIQLGFTPPATPNETAAWNDYSQNMPQNPFVPHFTPRTTETMYTIDPNGRYISSMYPNYIPPNVFVPDVNTGYENGNKYVLYPGQQPYVVMNQDIPVYTPVYPENRDYALFANQELNMQMPQNVMPQNSEMFMQENVMLQNDLKNKLLMRQNMQPQQNRTHLIENLVCNWAQNTNGTYSPFGNAQNTNYFEPKDDTEERDFKNFKTPINKKKQVAEVKPMRPTYSDVLTKSVPQTPKVDKIEIKDTKTKTVKNKTKNEKFTKANINRQSSTIEKENIPKSEKNETKSNLPRKWVSLDDVNEIHTENLFKTPDLQENNTQKNIKKNKKENNVKNETKNGVKKSFLDNSSLGCQWTESEDVSESSKNDERNVNKNPSKKGTF